jgi:hypothetical protein
MRTTNACVRSSFLKASDDIIRANAQMEGMLHSMRMVRPVVMIASALLGLAGNPAHAATPWDRPAAALAAQAAEILGPGQAQLTIRNLSTIPPEEIPTIRVLIEQDLKSHGIQTSGVESANTIRVTLSENARQRIWVAELTEGNETRVTMVTLDSGAKQQGPVTNGMMLLKQTVVNTSEPVLAALESAGSLIAVEREAIVFYAQGSGGFQEQRRFNIPPVRDLARDPRGVIVPSSGGSGFFALLAGMSCKGDAQSTGEPSVQCAESDDPWPLWSPQPSDSTSASAGRSAPKAFFNAARDYFTGVVSPGAGVDLPPFYWATMIPHGTASEELLVGGIDGRVQILENGALKPIAGTRDWGSDAAALQSGCGAGAQILVSGSGEAPADSLRAYELPALEAAPASAPLAMGGAVTALWTAPDGKSVFAVVRNTSDQYEVDRVSALCN